MQSETIQKQNFRDYLQKEFIRRCQDNPKYSLRAFAKQLHISHATLSHILRGKRPLTGQTILYLAKELELHPKQLERFYIPQGRTNPKIMGKLKFSPIEIDTFDTISDWYYDAILELTKVKQFKPEPKWIAKVLGIPTQQVRSSIKKLERLKLLKIDQNGKWLDQSPFNTTIKNDFTTTAFRKLQKQVLEKASRALEEVPYEKRDQSSVTLPIYAEDLSKAKKIIRDFRRKLCSSLKRKDTSPTDVYQLSVSFYPLTQLQENR